MIDALREPSDIAKELEQLRAQVAALQRLQGIPLSISRVSALECIVSDHELQKLKRVQAEERATTAEEQLKQRTMELSVLKEDNVKLKKGLETVEAKLASESEKREKSEQTITAMKTSHASEVAKLKMEVKDQRTRLHEVLQVTKRNRTPGRAASLRSAASVASMDTPRPYQRGGTAFEILCSPKSLMATATARRAALQGDDDAARDGDDSVEGSVDGTQHHQPRGDHANEDGKPMIDDIEATASGEDGAPSGRGEEGEDGSRQHRRTRHRLRHDDEDQPLYTQRDLERIMTQVVAQRENFSDCLHRAIQDFKGHDDEAPREQQQQRAPPTTAVTTSTAPQGSLKASAKGPSSSSQLQAASPEPVAPPAPAAAGKRPFTVTSKVPPFKPELPSNIVAKDIVLEPSGTDRKPLPSSAYSPSVTNGGRGGGATGTAASQQQQPPVPAAIKPTQVQRTPSGFASQQQASSRADGLGGLFHSEIDVEEAQKDLALMNERIARLEKERKKAESDERAAQAATEQALMKAQIVTTTAPPAPAMQSSQPLGRYNPYLSRSQSRDGGSHSPPVRRPGGAPTTAAGVSHNLSSADSMAAAYAPASFVAGSSAAAQAAAAAFGVVPARHAADGGDDPIVQAKLRYAALRSRLNLRGDGA
jgi:hypothetical protein